jgi:hypothetical protein
MYDVIGKRCKLLLYISTKMDHLPVIKKKEHKKKNDDANAFTYYAKK